MNRTQLSLVLVFMSSTALAVVYGDYELQQALDAPEAQSEANHFINRFFNSSDPQRVVDELLLSNQSALTKEYALSALMDAIRSEPPQPFHRDLIERMKTHPIEARRMHDEGPLEVPIFNLNAQAQGIENLWLAQNTESRFVALFNDNLKQALIDIQTAERRPEWLGVKNAFARLNAEQQQNIARQLTQSQSKNRMVNRLMAHVALETGDVDLAHKAATSPFPAVRQSVLRHASEKLPQQQAQQLLLKAAQGEHDQAFATTLLTPHQTNPEVSQWLQSQLKSQTMGTQAAFVLSQNNSEAVIEALRQQHLKSKQATERQNIVLALKLNPQPQAQMVLADLNTKQQKQWIQAHDQGGVK